MISVCIPVYNFNIVVLASKLSAQSVRAAVPIEVVFLDDGSEPSVVSANRSVMYLENIEFHEQKNRGRSIARNRLVELAKGEHLIFIDADCDVLDDFLEKYILSKDSGKVVVGGLKYGSRPKNKSLLLRWKVGVKREVRSLSNRRKNPHAHFLSSNFMVPKSVVEQITFEYMPGGYGHEDTLFGYALQMAQVDVDHIDNPVVHLGLDDASSYLVKLEQSIDNLVFLLKENPHRKDFLLLAYYQKMKQLRLTSLFYGLFKSLDGWVRRTLTSKCPSLLLLDIYKMFLLIEKIDSRKV